MINTVLHSVEITMENEYDRMADIHGKTFNSYHEAFCVTQEEFEEANEEIAIFEYNRKKCWNAIKHDADPSEYFEYMQEDALRAAAELIQVAACCFKARQKNSI